MIPRPFTVVLALLAGVALGRAAAGDTSILLRPSADLALRPAADGPTLHLADIADIDGPESAQLATVVIVADATKAAGADGLLDLSISDIRAALESSATAINWGRVSLSGHACAVRVAPAAVAPPRSSPGGRPSRSAPLPIDTSGPTTIRTLIAARLAAHFGVGLDDLRLSFDASDEDVLSLEPGTRRADVQPGAGPGSARLPMNILLYDGERISLSRVLNVGASVRRSVVTAVSTIERGQALSPDMISVQPQWGAPGGKALASAEQAAGAVAAQRIASGQTIAQSDITTPVVVKRGEIVYVHAVNGPFIVKAKARALGTARDGELVQLKLEGSDQVFSARMSGRGRAVLIVGESGAVPASPAEPGSTVQSPEAADGATTDLARGNPANTRVFAPAPATAGGARAAQRKALSR